MKTIYHAADSRGKVNHGWLKAAHSFSFASYRNPQKMNFGVLRVLNDDFIDAGMGFGRHPHDNMEIITIPLSGALRHSDSMGNNGVISSGEIQVMSAGSGVEHSEFNANKDAPVKLLQIWVIPNKVDVTPRYAQQRIDENFKWNEFQQIISPNVDEEGIWIHQDAWFNMIHMEKEVTKNYPLHLNSNGVYVFVIKGKIKIGDQVLNERDALGITDAANFDIQSIEESQVLLMEVPMEITI